MRLCEIDKNYKSQNKLRKLIIDILYSSKDYNKTHTIQFEFCIIVFKPFINGSLFRACVLLGMLIKRHEMKIIKNMYKKHTSAYVRYVCALYSAHTQMHKRFYRKFSIYGHTRYGCRTGSHWTRLPLKIYVYKFHRVYEAG